MPTCAPIRHSPSWPIFRTRCAGIPCSKPSASAAGGRGRAATRSTCEISGADTETLKAAAEALKTAVSRHPEVSALEDSMAYDKEELILELTPQGQALGFDIDGLGRVLRDRLNGIEAATFPDGPRSAAIRVELPAAELTADFLDRAADPHALGRLRAACRCRHGRQPHRLLDRPARERRAPRSRSRATSRTTIPPAPTRS